MVMPPVCRIGAVLTSNSRSPGVRVERWMNGSNPTKFRGSQGWGNRRARGRGLRELTGELPRVTNFRE